ncbi:MAG: hypothetical protein CM1200mP10_14230 [Candidatus Neomarinimicrobiota bacterium]|nr:MAG: hypothetical protein CM1200mP10_14230 [Candidatus Neomarinimicrobiota bacterium]
MVRSHATGVGKSFDLGITRLILFLKLSTWAKGVSGVRLELVSLVRDLLNHDILPEISLDKDQSGLAVTSHHWRIWLYL